MSIKQVLGLCGLVFAVTLAVFIGRQMSSEALAVVVGAVCGMAAGLPVAVLILVAVTRRDRQRTEELERYRQQGNYPPVVVIQGGAPQALPYGPQAGYWPAPQPPPVVQRQWHVVGDDEAEARLWLDDGHY